MENKKKRDTINILSIKSSFRQTEESSGLLEKAKQECVELVSALLKLGKPCYFSLKVVQSLCARA